MRSPYEGLTAFRFSLRRPRGPTQIRSRVAGDRYPEPKSFQERNSLPVVSFSRTQYRISLCRFFARGAYRQEGPTGQRGLLASGGGFGPGGIFPNSVTRVVPGLSGRSCQPIKDETPFVTSLLAQQHGARQAIAAVGVMVRWLTT